MAKLKCTYTAPRCAKVKQEVERVALLLDLDCKVAVSKGFLTEKGVIVCEGSRENLLKFKKSFESTISEYNK